MPLCWTGPFSREVRVYRYSSSSRMEKVTGRLASRHTHYLRQFVYSSSTTTTKQNQSVCLLANVAQTDRSLSSAVPFWRQLTVQKADWTADFPAPRFDPKKKARSRKIRKSRHKLVHVHDIFAVVAAETTSTSRNWSYTQAKRRPPLCSLPAAIKSPSK